LERNGYQRYQFPAVSYEL